MKSRFLRYLGAAVFVACLPASSYSTHSRIALTVDFETLDANPTAYHGRRVRVTGFVVGAPGALYLSKILGLHCHGDPNRRELYLDFRKRYEIDTPYFYKKKVTVEGIFSNEKYPKAASSYDSFPADDGEKTFGPLRKVKIVKVHDGNCAYP